MDHQVLSVHHHCFPIVGNVCIDDDDDGEGDGHDDDDDDRDILPQTVKLCFCLPPQV